MRITIAQFVLGAALALLLPLPATSQVTIGSDAHPANGALLDLKQESVTQKGLGLPRVQLSNRTNLFPMFLDKSGNVLAQYKNELKTLEDENHIGLLIYNVFKDIPCNLDPIASGLFVWSGKEWQKIGEPEKRGDQSKWIDNGDGTGSLSDYEGNVYPAKKFGDTWWTTKNLYSIRKADGNWIDCNSGIRFTLPERGRENPVKDRFPKGTTGKFINADVTIDKQDYTSFIKEFGLSYTYDQAMVACPNGWQLSSDADWINLIKFINTSTADNNPSTYMRINRKKTYSNSTLVANVWGANDATIPDSKVSGFNAVPSGSSHPTGTSLDEFSRFAFWWTSKFQTPRFLRFDTSTVSIGARGSDYRMAVRCTKQD